MNAAETNLRAAAEAVRAVLVDYDKAADAISRGSEQRDTLAAEIAHDIFAVNPDDPAALQLLAAKKSKLEILKSRVPSDEVLPPLVRSLRELLQTIPGPLSEFLSPKMGELVAKLDAELAKHIADAGARAQAVHENANVHQLRNIMAARWKVFEATQNPVVCARTVLNDLDALLDGQKPWLTEP